MTDWVYQGTVLYLHDGDTLDVDIDMGMRVWEKKVAIRVAHINAPELSTPEGKTALAFAQTLIQPGMVVTVTSHSFEKYGRLLASITLPDGSDFGQKMVDSGNAVVYNP